MCRWIVSVTPQGVTIRLSDILSKPAHSLVRQSHDASYHPGFSGRNNAHLNADGFGVAFYTTDGRACLYKSIYPAWSDPNLREIIESVESGCIFGHVRAASPGSVVSYENCHPFKFGKLTLMHNGHVENFSSLRRALLSKLTDEAFKAIKGLTDSEHVFALLLSRLNDPSRKSSFSPEELSVAIEETILDVLDLLKQANVTGGFTSLNLALTDGETVVCTRYCDKFPEIPPPSLYFSFPLYNDLITELLGDEGGKTAGPGDGSQSQIKSTPVPNTKTNVNAVQPQPVTVQPQSPLPHIRTESVHPIRTSSSSDITSSSSSSSSSSSTRRPRLADMVASLTAYSVEGGVDAHGVDSLRWSRDEAFLAASVPTASERVLLVASEPSTVGSNITWLTLPANAILIQSKGQTPKLRHLSLETIYREGVGGAGSTPL